MRACVQEIAQQLAQAIVVASLTLAVPLAANARQAQAPTAATASAAADTDTIEAGEADAEEPRRKLVRWNEYEGPFFTIRFGGGILYDYAGYVQDDESKQQFQLTPQVRFRDGRVLLKGRLKFKRNVTWSAGIMYDGASDSWLVRETGIMVEVPELWGHIFVGRTKEGFSLNKVMVGYSGWTLERSTISDATIPILADGVKWLGFVPKVRLLWNLGFYGDALSKGQSFSTYDRQFVGRVAWLPDLPNQARLHLGLSLRYGKPDEGKLRLRSRPEAFPAPYFVDTESFAADSTKILAPEVYYRRGSLLVGSEYFLQKAEAPASGNPWFHGGDVMTSWLITGETRGYNTRGGFFNQVSPARTVFERGSGGLGARCPVLLHRSGQRRHQRRPVLAVYTDGELASLRQRSTGNGLRVRRPGSFQSCWRDAVLPEPHSAEVLTRHAAPRVTCPAAIG